MKQTLTPSSSQRAESPRPCEDRGHNGAVQGRETGQVAPSATVTQHNAQPQKQVFRPRTCRLCPAIFTPKSSQARYCKKCRRIAILKTSREWAKRNYCRETQRQKSARYRSTPAGREAVKRCNERQNGSENQRRSLAKRNKMLRETGYWKTPEQRARTRSRMQTVRAYHRFLRLAFHVHKLQVSLEGKERPMSISVDIASYQQEIAGLSLDAMQEEFTQLYRDFFANIGRLAVRLVAIEAAGGSVTIPVELDMIDTHRMFLSDLRKVGKGEVNLKGFLKLWSHGPDLAMFKALPIEKQNALAELPYREIKKQFGSNNGKGTGRPNGFQSNAPNLAEIAAKASAKDLVNMVKELVEASPHGEDIKADLRSWLTEAGHKRNGRRKKAGAV